MTLATPQIKQIVEALTTDIDTYRIVMNDIKVMSNEDLLDIIAFMSGQLNASNQIINRLSNKI